MGGAQRRGGLSRADSAPAVHLQQQSPDLWIVLIGVGLFLKPTIAAAKACIDLSFKVPQRLPIDASGQPQRFGKTANRASSAALCCVDGFMVKNASKRLGSPAYDGVTNPHFATSWIPLT